MKKMSLFIVALSALFVLTGCPNKMKNAETVDPEPPAETSEPLKPESFGEGPGEFKENATETSVESIDGLIPYSKDLNFPVIYFAYNADILVPSETGKLDKVASYLQKNAALYLIIEGHCDQRGTEEYNRALGERRANVIRKYLAGAGVDDARMRTVSYGKDRPAIEGKDESAWGRNRRGMLIPAVKK